MKHEVVVTETATFEEHAEYVVCDLADSPPGPIALGLALLREALVNELILRPHRGRWVLRLRASGLAIDSKLSRYGEHRVELALSQAALGQWLNFFLVYHRDDQAEVDHLDLETSWANGATCDVVLKVGSYAPSVSIEEARRRLGMPPG